MIGLLGVDEENNILTPSIEKGLEKGTYFFLCYYNFPCHSPPNSEKNCLQEFEGSVNECVDLREYSLL